MTKVSYQLFSAGYCEAMQHHVLQGTDRKKIKFYATFGYIHHPEHGHILFDTGYTQRFFEETKPFPFFFYAKATKVYLKPEEEAAAQLNALGIPANEINYIIISHFHADHICGLSDFPNAKFICSTSAYNEVKDRKGIPAVKRAFVPKLMPPDFESRVKLIDVVNGNKEDKHLGKMLDLFDDGSILLMDLTGHAKGQIGVLVNTNSGNVLLAADAAWKKENFTKLHLPSKIVKLFFDSWNDFITSLTKVHNFHKANPETPIIACHCLETLEQYQGTKF